jgi:hypothetical protein
MSAVLVLTNRIFSSLFFINFFSGEKCAIISLNIAFSLIKHRFNTKKIKEKKNV